MERVQADASAGGVAKNVDINQDINMIIQNAIDQLVNSVNLSSRIRTYHVSPPQYTGHPTSVARNTNNITIPSNVLLILLVIMLSVVFFDKMSLMSLIKTN